MKLEALRSSRKPAPCRARASSGAERPSAVVGEQSREREAGASRPSTITTRITLTITTRSTRQLHEEKAAEVVAAAAAEMEAAGEDYDAEQADCDVRTRSSTPMTSRRAVRLRHAPLERSERDAPEGYAIKGNARVDAVPRGRRRAGTNEATVRPKCGSTHDRIAAEAAGFTEARCQQRTSGRCRQIRPTDRGGCRGGSKEDA